MSIKFTIDTGQIRNFLDPIQKKINAFKIPNWLNNNVYKFKVLTFQKQ